MLGALPTGPIWRTERIAMTIKARIFRVCLVLEYMAFIGLILVGIYESDAFNPRLLLPITLLGVACGINTWGVLDRPGGTREDDSPNRPIPTRRSTATRDTRNDR
jgi:hypothetical protein